MAQKRSIAKRYKAGKSKAKSKARRGTISSQARAITAIAKMAKGPSVLRTGGYSFKSQGGMELNFVDTNVALAAGVGSTSGYLQLLNGTLTGSNNNQRIGRRIDMKSIEFRFSVNNMAQSVMRGVRFSIVLDKQANGAQCNITDIWNQGEPTALRNISNKARFTVLWDSTLLCLIGNDTNTGGAVNSLTNTSKMTFQFYKKIGINTQYNVGSSGAIGDIQTNALYFTAQSDCAEADKGTKSIVIEGNFRIRFLP